MKNFIFMFLLAFFIFTGCHEDDMETWKVTVKLHNNSDYDVTDVLIWDPAELDISKLEKSSEKTFSLKWDEFKDTKIGNRIQMEYKLNGVQFNIDHQKDAVWYKSIPSGHWEWEEDGVKYDLTIVGETNYEEDDGRFISLQHFTNGAKIDIFIDNEGYRIEGGKFQKFTIPYLLPPSLRGDYPESYFKYSDRPPKQ